VLTTCPELLPDGALAGRRTPGSLGQRFWVGSAIRSGVRVPTLARCNEQEMDCSC